MVEIVDSENQLRKRPSALSDVIDIEKLPELNEQDIDQDSFEFEYNPDDRDFTWRAVLLGSLVGAVVSLSNIYLILKIGIAQGATLFATLLAGLTLKPFLALYNKMHKKSSFLGPKEHCCFQAAATACGALNGGLAAGVIPLFWLQQDPEVGAQQHLGFKGLVQDNVVGVTLIVLAAVGFGLFMAVPYRSIFIVNQNLQFPDGLAAAEIIKSSKHQSKKVYKKGRDKAQEAIQAKKVKTMIVFFIVGFLLTLLQNFAPKLIAWPVFHNMSGCGALQSPWDCLENPPLISGQGPFKNETLPGPVYREMVTIAVTSRLSLPHGAGL